MEFKLIDVKRLKKAFSLLSFKSPEVPTSGENTSLSFIDSISQTNGKIYATKKTAKTFTGSGVNHSSGLVPDPGGTAGSNKFLCENGSWKVVPTYGLKLVGNTLMIVTDGTGSPSITLPKLDHATSATYLRPANSNSTRVTADNNGNLSCNMLEFN